MSASPRGCWQLGLTQLKPTTGDRKSTRLNSSHQIISYAVFCLKKKRIGIVLEILPEQGDHGVFVCSGNATAGVLAETQNDGPSRLRFRFFILQTIDKLLTIDM